MNFGVNFIVEYRRQELLGDWFRIVVIEDSKRIKKSNWFQSQEMAHLRFRKQNYYAFSDWHKGFHKDLIPVYPVDQVFSCIKHSSFKRNQTKAEERREVRRQWFSGQRRVKK